MHVNLKSLIERLNDDTRKGLEAAAGLCLSRTHYDVEIEHYLLKLLDQSAGDFNTILTHFDLDRARLHAELTRSLDKLKSGNARTPAISPSLTRMLSEAWTIASLDFNSARIRSGHSVLALLGNDDLFRLVCDFSKELPKISADTLRKEFSSLCSLSDEQDYTAAAKLSTPGAQVHPSGGKTPNLDQYTVNLTERASQNKIDPVLGRDVEVRQVVDILTRRRQNNPILVGEAGVGKTAIVEGFALRVAKGDVPETMRNVSIRTLDLGLLQAGAGVKGEFESRLKALIEEVKSSPSPIILFIDEAHTMIGAGGQAGQNDAANLLKPALARGELRTIAATTWSEYKKYFEKDPALSRRFQLVKVNEPDESQCAVMLRGVIPALETHHNVRILEEGLDAAVRLSHRYLPDRQLPDKAVSVLDTACARLALGQRTVSPSIEDATRVLDDLAAERRLLEREVALGADHAERLESNTVRQAEIETKLAALNKRWDAERKLVEQIHQLRLSIEQGESDAGNLREELAELTAELARLQGETPMVRVSVDAQIIGEVISGWTGIPLGKMLRDDISTALCLERHLERRVIGQSHALASIAQRIRTARARLDDPQKPVGVFLLVGPSGVGKTETALALADLLYGGERNLITINMSEFQEAHTVSTLKGSPPGYVGYGEGGVLTEAVRRRPYSVVLLDEVEKAHPDVLELFFQVFDKGTMEDGEGRQIDFKNTVIILTSNAGTSTLMRLCAGSKIPPGPADLAIALKPELNRIFKPAFLGRLVIVPFYPVGEESLKRIIHLKLGKIQRRVEESHKMALTYEEAIVTEVAQRCTEVESGARNVDNILTNTMLPDISCRILYRIAAGERLSSLHVGLAADGSFVYS
jgi:type VI secretion system protein VasG